METKTLAYSDITADIIKAGKIVHREFRGSRVDLNYYQTTMRYELDNLGHAAWLNYEVNILYKGKPIGEKEIIHILVDNSVAICIVRGKTISEKQRDAHRQRIKDANLAVVLVISFDGKDFQWRRIDNDEWRGTSA